MLGQHVVDTLDRQSWLDRASKGLQTVVSNTFTAGGAVGQRIANLLHGTGTGHPLHPVITDVPIGAWTTALVLDALDVAHDDDRYSPGADAAIALGLAGAVGAALSGIADWRELDARPLRIGLVHGLVNITATLLYTGSFVVRKRGQRQTGRGLAVAGFGVATFGAYLGGDLVYAQRIGPTYAQPVSNPLEFTPVLADAELAPNSPRQVTAGDRSLVLVRQAGCIYALEERCSHLGGPLSEGKLVDGSIQCPWHASRFALADGRVLDGPASVPQPCYETRVVNGQIEVRAAQGG